MSEQQGVAEGIKKVVAGGFCIGCGACAFGNPDISIKKNEYGLLYPDGIQAAPQSADQICPFSSTINETEIGARSFANVSGVSHEGRIGYYLSLYAGYVNDVEQRRCSSSGGLATWMLEQLFLAGEIDAVVHVGETEGEDALFGYCVSHSIEELKGRAKSRYYPVHFDTALEGLDGSKRYAFTGIPCYIKAVRLLCRQNQHLDECIKYYVGIFCGHLKSESFAELLAWQQGIKPDDLGFIDFRVKNESGLASDYSIAAGVQRDNSRKMLNSKLYGTDWGLGYFKPLACEWCDDISAEAADIVFGDAWLPEYTKDSMGTNIVIVRNAKMQALLVAGLERGEIFLEQLPFNKIIQSQAANYRHRQEGLSVRIGHYESLGLWYPKKRVRADDYSIGEGRKNIYLYRMRVSEFSHHAFLAAKKSGSLFFFYAKMLPLELRYYYLNKRLVRGFLSLMKAHMKRVVRYVSGGA